ncbi:MAG TPA: hypothetical protein VK845_15260 [Gemmatimonadales bacterium]|nr:hypothetical protein [Gemmatimonadales bacterium]
MRLLLAALLVIVQAACVYGDPATPPRNDEATPSPALRSAQPLPSPARSPVDPGSDPTDSLAVPISGRAELGVLYSYALYTHCGIDYWASWDFDGSFWDVKVPSTTDPLARELANRGEDEGTIELVSADSARYTASNGLVIELTRSADRERRGVMCA